MLPEPMAVIQARAVQQVVAVVRMDVICYGRLLPVELAPLN